MKYRDVLKNQGYLELVERFITQLEESVGFEEISNPEMHSLIDIQSIKYLKEKTDKPFHSEKLGIMRKLLSSTHEAREDLSKQTQDIGLEESEKGIPKCAEVSFSKIPGEEKYIVGCMILNNSDPSRVDELRLFEVLEEEDGLKNNVYQECKYFENGEGEITDDVMGYRESKYCSLHGLSIKIGEEIDVNELITDKYNEILNKLSEQQQTILLGKINGFIEGSVKKMLMPTEEKDGNGMIYG